MLSTLSACMRPCFINIHKTMRCRLISLKEEISISHKTKVGFCNMHQLYTYKLGVLEADLGRQYIKFYLHVAFLLGILLDLCVIGLVDPMLVLLISITLNKQHAFI